jgi:predicted transcriptional regulator
MPKKYIRCQIFHPGKKEDIWVDIEVSVTEEEVENPNLSNNNRVVEIINETMIASLDLLSIDESTLYDTHNQPDYVGTIDEVILKILDESGGDI